MSLHVESNVQPLYIRRWELLMRYSMKVSSIRDHPCAPLLDVAMALPDVDMDYLKRISGFPIYERVASVSSILDFNIPLDVSMKKSVIPDWKRHKGVIRKLVNQRKDTLEKWEVMEAFSVFKTEHLGFHYVYTDGSKTEAGVGCAFVHGQLTHQTKLKKEYSIFTAEAVAVLQAVNYVKVSAINKSIICTDSMSVLLALQSDGNAHPLIVDARDTLHELHETDNECIVLWIPGHCGIPGNEESRCWCKDGYWDRIRGAKLRGWHSRIHTFC